MRFGFTETDRPTPRRVHWLVNALFFALLPTLVFVEQIQTALSQAGAPEVVTRHIVLLHACLAAVAKVAAIFTGGITNYKPQDR
ncbi:hypothetical protein [Spirosoma sordidisoli]|uniref:Uncharacterized protein n=1 Tax=Spirosoma sordidisoli TaxID=2502893 RepID=A0A4Q2UC22_9BACT|nr:hypothetical protein [Spirosoma sordidisoli]RYC66344.1 hypothetical protein EQG79_30180 [Spirosoma sordidisoli]